MPGAHPVTLPARYGSDTECLTQLTRAVIPKVGKASKTVRAKFGNDFKLLDFKGISFDRGSKSQLATQLL